MADKEVAIKINVDADGGAKSLSEFNLARRMSSPTNLMEMDMDNLEEVG